MRTVPIDTLEEGQIVRLPADMACEGVEKLAISREGDVVTLRPVRPPGRPSWSCRRQRMSIFKSAPSS